MKKQRIVPWIVPEVSPDLREVLLKHGTLLTARKNEVLLDEYVSAEKILFLQEGLASKGYINHALSKTFTMSLCTSGRIVAGYQNFFTHARVPRRVVALRHSTMIVVPQKVVDTIIHADFPLFKSFAVYLEKCSESDKNGLLALATLPTEARLKLFFAVIAHVFGENFEGPQADPWIRIPRILTRANIARIIYCSPLNLDRLLAEWGRKHLLERHAGQLCLDRAMLEEAFAWVIERQ